MVIFGAACGGDFRNRTYVEILSFDMTLLKIYDFIHYRLFWLWDFAVINQYGSEISPDSWWTSVCLVDKAVLKRFSLCQNFFIFSKIHDGLSKVFSKFVENRTSIKHGNFWSSMRRRRQESYLLWNIVIWIDHNEDLRP